MSARARPPRTGDEDVIGIPVKDAARVEAERTFRRQQWQDAMALMHLKLSPEEKELRRKHNTDIRRKRCAKLSPLELDVERAKARNNYHRQKATAEVDGVGDYYFTSNDTATAWWQIDKTCNFQDRKINPRGYPEVAYQCKRCKKCFWNWDDRLCHEYGLRGNYGTLNGVLRQVLIQPPCAPKGSNAIPTNKTENY